MIFYRVLYEVIGLPTNTTHHATLHDAHKASKTGYSKSERADVRIEQIDVDVSKAGVLSLLQGYSPEDFSATRTWALSPRGGLREIENGL